MFGLFKKPENTMWLIVGLGNPGAKYAGNRHNIGFMALDAIAGVHDFGPFKSKFQGEISEGRVGEEKALLLKPLTFMNESGQSVAKAAKFYKVPPARVVVLHDELDLEPGKMRAKMGGGVAGHNGLKSIRAHLGTLDFWRVRLGIGHPGERDRVSGYVLSDFAKSEAEWVERLCTAVAKHVPLLIGQKDNDFMTRVAEDVKEKA